MAKLRTRPTAWVWLIAGAFVCGVAVIVVACTVHNRCSGSDPACIYHSYTLLHTAGPAVLAFVGAPAVISLVVANLLRIKIERRSVRAGELAWLLAGLSCLIGVIGLVVEGFLMIAEAALTVSAVAVAPLPADPNDRLVRSGGIASRLPPGP